MDKLQMKITLEVVGKESFSVIVDYKDTTIETVKAVENVLINGLLTLNKEGA